MSWLSKLTQYAPLIAGAIATGGATLPALAAKAISDAVGVDVKTPEDVERVLESATPDQLLQLKQADNIFELEMAKLDVEKLQTVNDTMQAEYRSSSKFVSWWRPFFGYALAISWFVQMTGITTVFCYIAVKSPDKLTELVGQLALLSGSLTTLWGFALAVLGISVHKRSQDKQNGTDTKHVIKGQGILKSIVNKVRK